MLFIIAIYFLAWLIITAVIVTAWINNPPEGLAKIIVIAMEVFFTILAYGAIGLALWTSL